MLTQKQIDEMLNASREADEGPTQLVRRIEAAVQAAERERWRNLLEARAAGCERAAENTEDPKFDAMARVLMSVRDEGGRA